MLCISCLHFFKIKISSLHDKFIFQNILKLYIHTIFEVVNQVTRFEYFNGYIAKKVQP